MDGPAARTRKEATALPADEGDEERTRDLLGRDHEAAALARSRRTKAAGIPFTVAPDHLLPERLATVYLVFNEGYGGRVDLAPERSGSVA